MTNPPTKNWTNICELTGQAMDALVEIEQALSSVDGATLDPLEFRILLWARCSLATLYGIRSDETVNEAAFAELRAQLADIWADPLPATDRSRNGNPPTAG